MREGIEELILDESGLGILHIRLKRIELVLL